MKFIHRIYARAACSIGALGAGAAITMHPCHGVEHIGCIIVGVVLGFLGLFGFRGCENQQTNNVVYGDQAGRDLFKEGKRNDDNS